MGNNIQALYKLLADEVEKERCRVFDLLLNKCEISPQWQRLGIIAKYNPDANIIEFVVKIYSIAENSIVPISWDSMLAIVKLCDNKYVVNIPAMEIKGADSALYSQTLYIASKIADCMNELAVDNHRRSILGS